MSNSNLLHNLINEFNNSNFDEVYFTGKSILKDHYNDPIFLKLLGVTCFKLNKLDESIEYLSKSTKIKNDDFETYLNLGAALINKSEYLQAIKKLKRAIILNPNNEMSFNNIGIAYSKLNKNKEATNSFLKAIKINSNYLEAIYNVGLSYFVANKFEESKLYLSKVINKNKNFSEAYFYYGLSLRKLKEYDESIKVFTKILQINPNNEFYYYNIGQVHQETKKHLEAINNFNKAIEINPKFKEAFNGLGVSLLELNKPEEAIFFLTKAIHIDPTYKLPYNHIGIALRKSGKIKDAIKFYDKALKIDINYPSANLGKAICLFQLGKFKEGWDFYDGRLGTEDFIKRNSSLINVKNKLLINSKISEDSKILILREQGLGDEILYGTMYDDLLKNYQNVTIECDERLIPIFQNSFDQKYKNKFQKFGSISSNGNQLNNYDYVMYAGSLGKFFRKSIKDFKKNHYLFLEKNIINQSKSQIPYSNAKLNIGISWKSFKNRTATEKSLNLDDLKNVLKSHKCNFINIQYGDVKDEISQFNKTNDISINTIDNVDLYNDIIGVAGLLKNLDLFISVSNSTAHLAGALGVPTIVICPDYFFYYFNPWYDSVRVIKFKNSIKNTMIEVDKMVRKILLK